MIAMLLLAACGGDTWMRAAPGSGLELGPVQSALAYEYAPGGYLAVALTGADVGCGLFDGRDPVGEAPTVFLDFHRETEGWAGTYRLGWTLVGEAADGEVSAYGNRFGAWVTAGEQSLSASGYGEAELGALAGGTIAGAADTDLFTAQFEAAVCSQEAVTDCEPVEEVCNGIDDDCDGQVDEDVVVVVYRDEDGDGYGGGGPEERCAGGDGWASTSDDCDDTDPDVHPGATERCDGRDYDCDGTIDDGCA